MIRAWLAMAVLFGGTARGAGPSYSVAGIVNAANYAAGPFAPNSVLSVFGSGLARSTHVLAADDIIKGVLPVEMNYVRVYVQDQAVPLLFVSEGQINFLMSSVQSIGSVRIRVVTQGFSGPEIAVTLVDSAPALFQMADGFAIATHADGKLLTASSPAVGGDTIVVYATGLGRTVPNPGPGEIPAYAAQMVRVSDLKVSLGGVVMDWWRIKYAGLTPGSAGLYQINLLLPDNPGTDPEIRVTAGDQTVPAGLKLAVH
jgi:uncharacterized protein (TIGR03437 family)